MPRPGSLRLLLLLAAATPAAAAGVADGVVIVANGADRESVAIASHYAEARDVPRANIIVVAAPLTETITWKQFVGTLWQPLEEELVRRGWIDAIPMSLFDDVGRRKYAFSGHRITALVVCRGIPLRIANDDTLYKDVPPLTDHPQFRTNQGAVDSELSLLAQGDYPINASVPNPLFGKAQPTELERAQVVKVSRLDGPTATEAMGLVDLAMQAERTGLLGRAYVDIAGPHENGNRWLEKTADEIGALGIDLSVTRGPGTLPQTGRLDAPVLYFGWYAQDLNGPFALPGFRFPPGAVAVHIHSFSAHTLRSETEGWCGPLIARGATATVGNVYEPYLEYLHRPDMLLDALIHGDDLVDAAYYALPVLSWQSIVIGDPLYRPFASSPVNRDFATLPADTAGYAAIEQMNLLDKTGKQADVIEAGKVAMRKAPNLALGLALGRRLEAAGNNEQAIWTVKEAADGADTSTWNWELLREAAQFLNGHGHAAEAIDVYKKLFDTDGMPALLRSSWLTEAREVALNAGDTAQAADWRQENDQAVEKALAHP